MRRAGLCVRWAGVGMSFDRRGSGAHAAEKASQTFRRSSPWPGETNGQIFAEMSGRSRRREFASADQVKRKGEAREGAAMFTNRARGLRWCSSTPSGKGAWWQVLNVDADASESTIHNAYKNAVFKHHPDRGGNIETFQAIRAAYNEARASIESKESSSSAGPVSQRLTFKKERSKSEKMNGQEGTETNEEIVEEEVVEEGPLPIVTPPRDPLDFDLPSMEGSTFYGHVRLSGEGLSALGEYLVIRRQISKTSPSVADLRNWACRTFASLPDWQAFTKANNDSGQRAVFLKLFVEKRVAEEKRKEMLKMQKKKEKRDMAKKDAEVDAEAEAANKNFTESTEESKRKLSLMGHVVWMCVLLLAGWYSLTKGKRVTFSFDRKETDEEPPKEGETEKA